MNQIFADRFKSARLRSGLSLQDLANRLNNQISKQALHKYEKGAVVPDSERLGLLSTVMNVRPDYFFRETSIQIGDLAYRSLKSIPAKEEYKVIEQTREYLSRYLELEEILGLENKFENPLADFGLVSEYQQVNQAANLLRKKWEIGKDPIYNVAELLEDKFIKVVEIDADTNFNGMQTWVNGSIPVVAFNKNLEGKPDRIRFTLLHELGHLLLNFGNVTENQKEILCHQFAGAILMPEETLKQELGAHRNKLSLQELGNIKKHYGISMQAIVKRALECGIVNDHFAKQFLGMMKEMGWRTLEPVAYEGVEKSNRFDQLIFRGIAEEQISMTKAAALKNMRLAEFHSLSLTLA
ncbi:XRE family transcriptional regulator [Dyadobacter sp. LJ53]|uniref:helix-turn-helix domain-containing protein n=1 Tax=Dyadobacter chenwenxiniae TaxID=2906456 RepID=UPI001F362EE7|nr:XRE family transcriptional regulator [Dyadobacter chenwenxiniae]MCF0050608.1 XRE family transcriptional regulator [Dyadobacter chenwenxiniae]